MSLKSLTFFVVLSASGALAQSTTEFTSPPLVPAAPPPMPAPEPTVVPPSTAQNPGTPPPPSLAPTYIPGQQGQAGYQYSPYGQPRSKEKPGAEIGLMVSESLFGALTAAGVTLLPYFLLISTGALRDASNPSDRTLETVIFSLIFGAAPLAVSQTQLGIANGSRYYQTESWIPSLVGLAAMAGVIGIFLATGGVPLAQVQTPGGVPQGQERVVFLMIGAIGIVPLLQMASINIFKQPRPGMMTLGDPVNRQGIAFRPPTIAPIVSPNSGGLALGAQLSLLRGNF
jgi:hypothetical protein